MTLGWVTKYHISLSPACDRGVIGSGPVLLDECRFGQFVDKNRLGFGQFT